MKSLKAVAPFTVHELTHTKYRADIFQSDWLSLHPNVVDVLSILSLVKPPTMSNDSTVEEVSSSFFTNHVHGCIEELYHVADFGRAHSFVGKVGFKRGTVIVV